MNTIDSNLSLSVVDPSDLSDEVWEAMASDTRTRGQYATTTAWAISGDATGEAIGLVTGEGASTSYFSIILINREAHVIESSGLQSALKELGYTSRIAITI